MANRPNLSGVVDPEIAGLVEEESQKRGLKKSATLNEILKRLGYEKKLSKKKTIRSILNKNG